MGFIAPILILGALGLGFGAALALASKQFRIEVDPKEQKIIDALPGNNCGACGLSGCNTFAKALLKGELGVASCVVGGEEVAKKLKKILGKDSEKAKK